MIKIIGKENIPNKPVIFVSNHPCSTDVWIIPFLFKKTKILINDGFKIPILSQILSFLGHINCTEKHKKSAISECTVSIRNGYNIFIFPEGKLSKSIYDLHEFKGGFLKIHEITGASIVPVMLIPNKIIKINDKLKLAFSYKIIIGKQIIK
jgi:1-acyl-sn-glycerol-3-phosphate acyltransferase